MRIPKTIIHQGNNNIRRRVTTCGQKASWDDMVEPEKVTCISCVSRLAYPKTKSRKTEKWLKRLEELKAMNNGH